MRKATLKMSVDDVAWVEKKYTSDYESVPKEELDHNSWWYLHGELESLVGYDKAFTLNCKSAGYSRETINWAILSGTRVKKLHEDGVATRFEMYVNGVIPVEVTGVTQPCVGYFWVTEEREVEFDGEYYPVWCQRGLVVLESDWESRKYAMEKMSERTTQL